MKKLYFLFWAVATLNSARSAIFIYLLALLCVPGKVVAQAPNIHYSGPKTYVINTTVPILAPVNIGGAVPGNIYSEVTTFATGAAENFHSGIAIDSQGNVYWSDLSNNLIRKATPAGVVSIFASASTGLNSPSGLAIDQQDNIFANCSNYTVQKITPSGVVSTYAGSGAYGFTDGPALSAKFTFLSGITADKLGNVYVSDFGNYCVRKISTDGVVTTFAGNGTAGKANGTGTNATFNYLGALTIDGAGNIFVIDTWNYLIREITPAGEVSTFAGNGGTGQNNGSRNMASFQTPQGICVDTRGNLFISDSQLIRKINSAGAVSTLAGVFNYAFVLDGIGTQAAFSQPLAEAIDKQGNLYIVDDGSVVRKIKTTGYAIAPALPAGINFDATTGKISGKPTVLSPPTNYAIAAYNTVDSSSATVNIKVTNGNPSANASLAALTVSGGTLTPAFSGAVNNYTVNVGSTAASTTVSPTAADAHAVIRVNGDTVATASVSKNIPLISGANIITISVIAPDGVTPDVYTITINRITPPPGINYGSSKVFTAGQAIVPIVPNSSNVDPFGFNNIPVTISTGISSPKAVAVDAAGNVYVAGSADGAVTKLPAGGGAAVTLGLFGTPRGLAVDLAGNVYIAAINNTTIKKIPAGGGSLIDIGSGFKTPYGVSVDAAGNVFVADSAKNDVEEIPADGSHQFVVSNSFFMPTAVATDASGTLYVADCYQNRVWKVILNGMIGARDNGYDLPFGVATDAAGNLYVADSNHNSIRMISAADGSSVNIGSGFNIPTGITVDKLGNVYVADKNNNAIKQIKPVGGYFISPYLPVGLTFDSRTGTISGTPLVASPATTYTITAYNSFGSGTATINLTTTLPPLPDITYSGPDTHTFKVGNPISPLVPQANNVGLVVYGKPIALITGIWGQGIAVGKDGSIYVTETNDNGLKKFTATGGGPLVMASGLNGPKGVAIDGAGNIYFADSQNNAIKKINSNGGNAVSIGSGFVSPQYLTVDAAGNVYVVNGNGAISKVRSADGSTVIIASGYTYLTGIAVNLAGDLFFSDGYSHSIYKIPVGSSSVITLSDYFNTPANLAVDAADNLYVVDRYRNTIEELPAGNNMPVTLVSGMGILNDMTVDTKGNIYFVDAENQIIGKIKPTGGYNLSTPLPIGLTFDNNTGIISGTPGVVSALSTYTVTANNIAGSISAQVKIGVAANVDLNNLTLYGGGTIRPAFAAATTNYTDSVSNATTTISVTPILSYPASSIKVNGTAVESGSSSASIPLSVGNNTISVVVTWYDGTASQTYTIIVTRAASTVATLNNLTISNGMLSPSFASTTTSYADVVNYGTTAIYVTPTVTDANATVKVNGVAVQSGVTSPYQSLQVGANVITTVVTAQNGTSTQTYTVTVTRMAPSSIATLSNLSINAAALSPVFASATTSYTASVPNGFSTITLTPVKSDTGATVKVNGAAVSSGASANIALASGSNTITVIVTAQDGTTTKTYTVTVTRLPPSAIATLSNLIISSGTLSPVFASATTAYTTSVPNATTSITLTPIKSDSLATVKVNGVAIPFGATSASIALAVGSNTITIVVTAQDGTTTNTYTLTITRAFSSIATLNNLLIGYGTLTPAFTSTTNSYSDIVDYSVIFNYVLPTSTDPSATVKVNGTDIRSGFKYYPLNVGSNIITTVVTAQDGTTSQTYTVTVTRMAPSAIATLSNLTISNGTLAPVFASTTTAYTVNVPNATGSVTITPDVTDPAATIKVNGVSAKSDTASASVPLAVGSNTITTVVTAQDGTTAKTYSITVTRLSNNANLANLTLSSGALSPTFASATVNYTASVTNATTSIQLTPTTSDANATIQVNGVPVTSGTSSANVPLALGANTIHVVVHAQDGTQRTYTVVVTRLANNANLANLTLSTGTLSPTFISSTSSYTGTVSNTTASIKVTPTTSDTKATVTVNGVATLSGAASASIALNGGVNTIYVVVTAQDGTRKTYTLTITKPLSNNANLANLTISSGTLAPAFISSTVGYTATVSATTTSIQLTPTTSDVNATVQVNSVTVKSGTASAGVPLSIGVNSVHAVVHAQDGTQRTYTVTVTRLSNNANLASLTISNGTLSPAFVFSTTGYTDTVSNAIASVQLTPTTSEAHATITVNGTAVTSGRASAPISLIVGNNTIYAVVLAQDGTRKTYTITVRRLTPGGLNNLFLPGDTEQAPLTSSLDKKLEANNILSPNGDGTNDIWVVKNIAFYPNNTVTVYNRAGQVVFTKKGYTNDWDGTYRGSVLSEGSYYYLIDLGNGKSVKGFITVVGH